MSFQGYRKVKLCCEDVQGTSVLTNFHGMDLTRDKLCSLIKKWQTLIEAQVDVRTTDGYLLRIVSVRIRQSKIILQCWCAAACRLVPISQRCCVDRTWLSVLGRRCGIGITCLGVILGGEK